MFMQTANAWLRIHKDGTVPIRDITPAEAVVLNSAHLANANGVAVTGIVDVKDVDRTAAAEIKRLREKYPFLTDSKKQNVVEKTYPGVSPALPKTFREAGIVTPSGGPVEEESVTKTAENMPVAATAAAKK